MVKVDKSTNSCSLSLSLSCPAFSRSPVLEDVPASPRPLERAPALHGCPFSFLSCVFAPQPTVAPVSGDNCSPRALWAHVVVRALAPVWGRIRVTEGKTLGRDSDTEPSSQRHQRFQTLESLQTLV